MKSNSIFLVDDQLCLLQGISCLLRHHHPEVDCLGYSLSSEDALSRIIDLKPDVAMLALKMSPMNGFELLRLLKEADSPSQVIFLTRSGNQIYQSIRLGARGYIMRSVGIEGIIDAVAHVCDGEIYVGELSTQLADQIGQNPLTNKELQILRLISNNHNVSSAAFNLGVEESTVRSHMKRVYRKLDVVGATSAVASAMRQELIE